MSNTKNATDLLDPFWPGDAVPTFLSIKETNEIVDSIALARGLDQACPKCGQLSAEKGLCAKCSYDDAQNTALARKTNANWMDEANAHGIEIFERQQEETDTEWRIWSAYRGFYPGRIPTYAELSAQTGHAVATVVKAANKWSYKVRLLAWARFTDADIQDKRVKAIREMNEQQLAIAQTAMLKLSEAVTLLQPACMRPGEITSMLKVVTTLQKDLVAYVPEVIVQPAISTGKNADVQLTKAEDISEIMAILQSSGALDNKIVGIKTASGTQVMIKGDK